MPSFISWSNEACLRPLKAWPKLTCAPPPGIPRTERIESANEVLRRSCCFLSESLASPSCISLSSCRNTASLTSSALQVLIQMEVASATLHGWVYQCIQFHMLLTLHLEQVHTVHTSICYSYNTGTRDVWNILH